MRFSPFIRPGIESEGEIINIAPIVQVFFDDHISESEGQKSFGPRFDGNPFIGTGSGDRKAGLDLDDLRLFSRPSLSQVSEGSHGLHGRRPGGQNAGPEGNNIIAIFKIVGQRMVDPLGQGKCLDQAGV